MLWWLQNVQYPEMGVSGQKGWKTLYYICRPVSILTFCIWLGCLRRKVSRGERCCRSEEIDTPCVATWIWNKRWKCEMNNCEHFIDQIDQFDQISNNSLNSLWFYLRPLWSQVIMLDFLQDNHNVLCLDVLSKLSLSHV